MSNNIRAGLFITIFIVCFGAGIFILGKERQIFARQQQFTTYFRDVGGLAEGAPVRMGGISVGRVDDIRFSKDPYDQKVVVTLLVNTKYVDRIRQDSVCTIETQGLLGDKFLSISSGMAMASQPNLSPGSVIGSKENAEIGEFLAKAQTVVANTEAISNSINEVINELKEDTLKNLARSTESFANLMKQVEHGDGLAHKVFYSKRYGDKIVENLDKTSQNLARISSQVKNGDNLLNSLIYDSAGTELVTNLNKASGNLAQTSQEITLLAKEIREGSGTAHQLIYGESVDINDKISDAISRIDNAAAALERASLALANGEGTIGALLVDPQLYENLVEITDGAKRSFILKQAVRASLEGSKKR